MMRILIAENSRSIRITLKERLEYEGYHVETAENEEQMQEKIRTKRYDLLIRDLSLEGGECGETIEQVTQIAPQLRMIVLSSLKDIDIAVQIMRQGAYDYLLKPIDFNRLLESIRKLTEIQGSEAHQHPVSATSKMTPAESISSVKASSPLRGEEWVEMVGNSMALDQIRQIIHKVAPSDARVLITGANGTGKELVAKILHQRSVRVNSPFIEVNCAAIPSELIESELFGHEKGAFTSAIRQRKGKFEQAHSGTLFLDEIGDMSLSAQAKVLRALQENKVSRVGSDKDLDVDVRVIAATNKDLQQEIVLGNFREDLYHRLSVIVIRVPSLCERIEDIPLLVDHFITQLCAEYRIDPRPIEEEALLKLAQMEWTGNIRELRNVVERLIILSEERITTQDISSYVSVMR